MPEACLTRTIAQWWRQVLLRRGPAAPADDSPLKFVLGAVTRDFSERQVSGPERSIKPEIFVATGVCTHLGCSPTLKKEIGAASDMGADWPGGYYCPCHNSRFDLSARVLKGSPAPKNLAIPPHRYATDTVVVIGEDTKGA